MLFLDVIPASKQSFVFVTTSSRTDSALGQALTVNHSGQSDRPASRKTPAATRSYEQL